MKIWAALYGMVWLIALEFLTLFLLPRGSDIARWLHVLLGVGIVALAFVNANNLAATPAPARVKRIAKALFGMSAAGAAFGVLLYYNISPSLFGWLQGGPIYMLHIMMALAIVTQAASIATSYDMWEEKEYEAKAPAPEAAARAEAPSTAL